MCEIASERGIDCSAGSCSGFHAGRGEKKQERGREQSEAYVIYSGECYVGGSNY